MAEEFDFRECHKYPLEDIRKYAKSIGIKTTGLKKLDLCKAIREAKLTEESEQAEEQEPGNGGEEVTNEYIANQLEKEAKLKGKGGKDYSVVALKTSASIIRNLDFQITSISQLKGIKGIGEGTKRRVDEILKLGALQGLEQKAEERKEKMTEDEKIIEELKTILFIGDAKAKQLLKAGVKGIEDLRERIKKKDKRIDLTDNQLVSLKYYNDMNQKIPYADVSRAGKCIIQLIKDTDSDNVAYVVGSHRRGKPFSSDVDILMSNTQGRNTLKEVVDFLTDDDVKFIVHTFSFGKVKFQGLYNYKYAEEGSNEENLTVRKIDVRWVPFESIWSSMLHSTGSDASNVRLRKLALEKGMTLSEFGLFDLKTRDQISIESEEDIFRILGTEYLPPEKRD